MKQPIRGRAYEKSTSGIFICVMLAATVLGSILYVYCCMQKKLSLDGLWENVTAYYMEDVSDKERIVCVLSRRIPQILLFVILFHLIKETFVIGISAFVYALYYGFLLSGMLLQFGIKGIGYGAALLLPYLLFYGMGMMLAADGIRDDWNTEELNRVKNAQYLFKKFVIFFLIFLGLIWEIKFQKNILKNFYQYLVL